MADDLNTMLTDGAGYDEDRDRLAGSVQDPSIVNPAGSSDNKGGNTGFGDGEDNTITEQAPEGERPAVAVSQDIPEPKTDVGGGSGGLAGGTSTTNETPQVSSVAQTAVAQSDPTLQDIAAPVAAEEPSPEPQNVAPVDADEVVTVSEDSSASGNLLSNVVDPDGATPVILSFGVDIDGDGVVDNFLPGQTATIAGVGTITIGSNGDYTFDPVDNYNGSVPTITYTVSDQAGGTDTSTLDITVTPVNDALVDGDETVEVAEDTNATGNVLLNVVDPDGLVPIVTQFTVPGDANVYTAGQAATIAGVGTITIGSNGDYTFDPVDNYNGSVPTITYTVSDQAGG
ncbi:cadherin-like domain-containing protein, partial [Cyanobium sp. Maggiore-St4-Cus]|uniref:Ig-like domain-containing protein n=1 Tax=Cyanobium sp. Maggiore-St4-Cus TaxID=2823717 RepID=UPI0020CE5961